MPTRRLCEAHAHTRPRPKRDLSKHHRGNTTFRCFQVTWIVCRKFQFQCFNYLDENGKGTVDRMKAHTCVPATVFLVADHLSQLVVSDGMPREGV
jgi:hypothetical protein